MLRKLLKNRLQPMPVTQVIGYDIETRKNWPEFLKGLTNKRKKQRK